MNYSYFKGLIKHFHNYSNSVYSTKNHYSKFFESFSNYSLSGIEDDFKEIKDHPLRLFIFALRNNMVHYKIPPLVISIISEKEEDVPENTIFLRKGKFQVKKQSILKDHFLCTRDVRGESKFLRNEEYRKILCSYLQKEYSGTNKVDLKTTICFL